jgi:hypothetical protein
VNVKGDTFIFHILPEYAIRFNDLNFVFITWQILKTTLN